MKRMQVMRKVMAALLSAALALALVPATAMAALADEVTPATIVAQGTCEAGGTWSLDGDGVLTLSGAIGWSGTDSTSAPWHQNCRSIKSVVFAEGAYGSGSVAGMLYDCESLASLDLSGFDTSKVTRMDYTFCGCSSLTSLDLTGLDTSNVVSMHFAFATCTSLATLNLSRLVTSNVTDMYYMFAYCPSLTNLDLSLYDTSKVTDMCCMFYECSSLTSLDLSRFDTSNVTDMRGMFYGCSSLAKVRFGYGFALASSYLPVPALTVSGAKSDGTWGYGSESSKVAKTAYELATLGKTQGALAGTWYAQRDADAVCTVTFDADGGALGSKAVQKVETGDTAAAPAAPVRDGYTFAGWATEKGISDWTKLFSFDTPITADITLYAQWTQDKEEPVTPTAPATKKAVKTFTVNVKTVTAKAVASAAKKAGATTASATSITLGSKVKTIKASAFKSFKKVKTITVKTKKLTKKSVKKALKSSKVKTIKVKIGSKKVNKKYVKKHKKIFTKKVCGKKVKVR